MRLMAHTFLPIYLFLLFAYSETPVDPAPKVSYPEEDGSYRVESIPTPEGLTPETGAIGFLPDGRLAACFLRGEIMLYDPKTKEWSLFAEGLHEPLGVLVVSDSELLVMQKPELTRVKDTDGDGKADLFETVTNDFGMSGNYHEWNYGPVKDRDGNLFISLSTASIYGKIMEEVRGKLDTSTLADRQEKYSAVPYRGWVMQLTPKGNLLPYASGFRSPNGLGVDQKGHLFVTDNQGGWVGTNALYQVQKGKFYGHPGSLIWEKDWKRGSPFQLPVQELDNMRTRASVLFPYVLMGNSLTQPLCDDTQGKFGPFAGQLFVGDTDSERIMRVMLEEIGGALQGACIPFMESKGLRKGNNRLAFAPDGSLWVGQVSYGFIGDTGIQRIVYTGKPPMDIYSMNLTAKGFDLTFTQPVEVATATNPANYGFRHYYYAYHEKYGSDLMDVQPVSVSDIVISADRRKVSITLPSLKPGYLYELKLKDIKAASGEGLENNLICYTLNKLKK
jgi:glucose/arabinose dehydrogenase